MTVVNLSFSLELALQFLAEKLQWLFNDPPPIARVLAIFLFINDPVSSLIDGPVSKKAARHTMERCI
jgi:hypothetical protein